MCSHLIRHPRRWLASGVVLLGVGLGACQSRPEPERVLSTSIAALSPTSAARLAARAIDASVALGGSESPIREPSRVCPDVELQARAISATLPRVLDADTIATKVTAEGCDLTLEYQLMTLAAQDVQERGVLAMRSRVVGQLCLDPGALGVMQRGGRFTNVYYDRTQVRIGLFTVAADDCGI
jgi:hypothetical protein